MNTKNFILIFLLTLTNNWLGLHVDDNMVLGSQIEKTLRQDLFQNYSSDVRPVLNNSEPVKIEMGIAIKNLEEFNQKIESIKLNIWLRMNWKNEYMSWNTNNYEGMDFLAIKPEQVWVPDIELYNAGGLPEIYTLVGGMNLYNNGEFMWSRPGIFKFSCPLKLEEFPFDTQSCQMTFGSWVYNNQYLELAPYSDTSKAIDILDDFSHSEWELLDMSYQQQTVNDDSGLPKDTITYTVRLKRYSHYYQLSMGMTGVLVFVSFIIMLVAPDNLSRTGTAVFIPLTILALQLTIADKVPVVGYYTLMDKYFLACFVCSMFVSIESGVMYALLMINSTKIFNWMESRIDMEKIRDNPEYNITEINRGRSYNLEVINNRSQHVNEGNNIYTNQIFRTIAHDNSDLYLSENNMIVKKIFKKYCVFTDNLFRLATPLIFSIYIGALINGR